MVQSWRRKRSNGLAASIDRSNEAECRESEVQDQSFMRLDTRESWDSIEGDGSFVEVAVRYQISTMRVPADGALAGGVRTLTNLQLERDSLQQPCGLRSAAMCPFLLQR
eukprot:3939623-Rhodomonas_salina.2